MPIMILKSFNIKGTVYITDFFKKQLNSHAFDAFLQIKNNYTYIYKHKKCFKVLYNIENNF